MAKAQTRPVEIEGLTINVPVGSMDRPTAASEAIMASKQNPNGWKHPQQPHVTADKDEAEDLAYCYNWYLGGHEIESLETEKFGPVYVVTSKGYYHYIGA